jgi:hypothetical protein
MPPPEVEHLAAGEALLQAQGVGDVVGAAQVPGSQLQQVAGAHGFLVKAIGLGQVEGAGMQGGQGRRTARQAQLQLRRAELQKAG